jgi:XTP/dITP diphosphohydrolase
MQLTYGSTNLEKLAEVARIGIRYSIEVIDSKKAAQITGRGMPLKIHESELSYERNAVLKARAYAQWFGQPCMADDSGIEIGELGGLPGVYTARYGVLRVLESLIPSRHYEARFVCCVAYVEPSGRSVSATAALQGTLSIPRIKAVPSSSLPYSHFFIPLGREEALSMTLERDVTFLSHRGRAFTSLVESLGLHTSLGMRRDA